MKRNEQEVQNCWNLDDLYESDQKWKEDFDRLERSLPDYPAHIANMGKSADKFLAFLMFDDKLSMLAEKIYVYANLKSHEDTANATYQDLSQKASALMVKMKAQRASFSPTLLKIGEKKILECIESDSLEENQKLSTYRHYILEFFRKQKHTLSDEMEELLANVSEIAEGASDIFSMYNNADVKFDDIINEKGEKASLTQGNFILYLQSKNRDVRKAAFESLYKQYKKIENTLAATYFANVKQHVFYAKARKYKDSLSYGLDDANIPVEVYKQLIKTVHQYLPLMHRYMNVRKRIMKLDELHMYDIYLPLVNQTERKYTFEEAKDMVKRGLHPLGEEYLSRLQEGFENRWIDVYENEGKRNGAYSWGAYGTHPYVLLNYEGNLNSVFTLAHEMGHALHSHYSDEAMEYVNAGYKIFVAEVASTCNEALLIHYLLSESKNASPSKFEDEKKYLLNYFLEQFRGTLFRQTMFAEFEMITHEMVENGEILTAKELSSLYRELNRKYYGEAVYLDEQIEIEWARIPHFYRSFYVYQYATGFSAAIAISRKILDGDHDVISGYKKFLQSGGNLDPIDLLKLAGVDMRTSEPIEDAMKLFGELLDEFEE